MSHFASDRFPLLIALICLAFAALSPVGAAVDIDARVGFSGFYIPGEWTPIEILISNLPGEFETGIPPDLVGEITLITRSESAKPFIHRMEVDLPGNSQRHLWMVTKIADADLTGAFPPVEVEFRATNRRARALTIVRGQAIPPGAALVLIARDPGQPISVRLPGISESQSFAVATVGNLPRQWAALSGVAAIFVTRSAALSMGAHEVDSLRHWVEQGGSLVVDGAAGSALAESPIAELLPVQTGERTTWLLERGADFSPLPDGSRELPEGAVTLLEAQVRDDGRILWALPGGDALVAQRNLGLGTVSFLAWDLTNANMERVGRAAQIIAGLVPPVASMMSHSLFHQVLLNQIDPDPTVSPPNALLVLLLLAAYWVVVGPVNYFRLSRRKRIELSWVTIPIIIAVFCALFYAIGHFTRSNRDTLRHINVAMVQPGRSLVRADDISLYFSAAKQRISLRPSRPDSTLSLVSNWESTSRRFQWQTGAFVNLGNRNMPRPQPGWGVTTGPPDAFLDNRDPATVVQRRDRGSDTSEDAMWLEDQLVRQWSFTNIESQGTADLGGTIDVDCIMDFRFGVPRFTGSVTNNTPASLEFTSLHWGDLAALVGDGTIEPGETALIDTVWTHGWISGVQQKRPRPEDPFLNPRNETSSQTNLIPGSVSDSNASTVTRDTFANEMDFGDPTHIRYAAMRAFFLDDVQHDWLNPRTGRPHLIAYTDRALLAPEPERPVDREEDCTMLIMEVPIRVESDAQFTLQSPMLPVTHLINATGDDDVRTIGGLDTPMAFQIRNSDLRATYSLPWPQGDATQISSLSAGIRFSDSPSQYVRLFALDRVSNAADTMIEIPVRIEDGTAIGRPGGPGPYPLDPSRVIDPTTGEITLVVRVESTNPNGGGFVQAHAVLEHLSLTVGGRLRPTEVAMNQREGEEPSQ